MTECAVGYFGKVGIGKRDKAKRLDVRFNIK